MASKNDIGPIVSSAHLADGGMPELSEMEFALIGAHNAFSRWTSRCMDAAGEMGMTHLEILVLHSAHHRERDKTLTELCTALNIDDTHLVSYAIKKLEKTGLATSGKRGKEKTVTVTDAGREACAQYKRVREALLVSSITDLGLDVEDISRIARMLRGLSGQYDQAGRAAASL